MWLIMRGALDDQVNEVIASIRCRLQQPRLTHHLETRAAGKRPAGKIAKIGGRAQKIDIRRGW